jgi:formylglycine-generating enzyme required for sulfatase activity
MNAKHFLRAMIAILSLAVAVPASAQCTGDINNDGVVNGGDLGTQLSWWGPVVAANPVSVASDLDGNGLINGADLGLVLSSWGPCQSTITSITPNQGCIVGGTQITITGTYLSSTSAVTVGGAPVTSFTVVNQNTVQATTPAGAAGPGIVRVTTAAGTINAPQTFTYMPASVSSIAPSSGIAAGGTQIMITGSYLGLTTGITIGGVPCTGVTVLNATTVAALTPAGTVGNADLVITGGKGTITVPGGFRYVSVTVPLWATLVEAHPNPAVVTDPAIREAIAATGLAWRVRDTATQIEMLLMPPGIFQMGCIMGTEIYPCYSWELPVHQVTLTNAFYLGRYEVTQAQWRAKMGSNPSAWVAANGWPGSDDRPVDSVNWTSIAGYLAATGFRLPTEAEWEYACRGGTQAPYYDGSMTGDSVTALAWWGYCGQIEGAQTFGTAVGGLKAANPVGLYDMLGNVWECVSDWYGAYSGSPQTNPTGPAPGTYRVLRGGGICSFPNYFLRSSYRYNVTPDWREAGTGFRVARNP